MPILINKNDKQLGPYSLDEARALVLSGELSATDWAWPDGATEWVQLKSVPGFAPTAPVPPSRPPEAALLAEEETLWSGHPSQILNAKVYASWAVLLLATLVSALFFPMAWAAFAVLVVVALIHGAIEYLRLHAITYVITTQRVRVLSGIFSKDIQEIELFRVKDTAASQTFFLRLFGLGTLVLLSGDESHPRIVLNGIPQAVELRERLRHEIIALRQRYGVRELDVMK